MNADTLATAQTIGLWALVGIAIWWTLTKREVIQINSPAVSDHISEIVLLGIIAGGVIFLAGRAIDKNDAGEASAWTAVLMAIINAIKERWQQRSLDRMGQSLANAPPAEPPATEPKP